LTATLCHDLSDLARAGYVCQSNAPFFQR
jgi:hypothetical protein